MITLNNNQLYPILLEKCQHFGRILNIAFIPKSQADNYSFNTCDVEVTIKSDKDLVTITCDYMCKVKKAEGIDILNPKIRRVLDLIDAINNII